MPATFTSQVTETAACALCGLALPRQPVSDSEGARYCCQGCLHVADILRSVGSASETGRSRLDAARRYGLLSAQAAVSNQTSAVGAQHSALGTQDSERRVSEHTDELRFRIAGLACPSCAWLAEAVLTRQPGVIAAEVDFVSDTARVVLDLRTTSRQIIEHALAAAGFGAAPLECERSPDERRDLVRLALAAFVACHQMMLAWVGYDTFLTGEGQAQSRMIGWVQLLFALPVVTWSALPLYRRALAALKQGRLVMESLLTLGIAAASALSLVMLLLGETHVYLETATALVAISLGGRAAERWLKRRATRSLTALLRFGPTKARRADDERFAPLEEFPPGARILVEQGETVPLDVRVAADPSPRSNSEVVVQEALLTGEPHPVVRRAGDVILAGSTIVRGQLVGMVVRSAGHTMADAIRERATAALRRTDGGSRLADRLVEGLVPLVLLIAGTALIGHLWHGDGSQTAFLSAVAVLVVACPCAFGVAASSALSLATLRLMQAGVLVKDPTVLEGLASVDTIIFDKTGTITQGDLSLTEIGWKSDDGVWRRLSTCADSEWRRLSACENGALPAEHLQLLALVRALEEHSHHPIAVSLTRLLAKPSNSSVVEEVIESPGFGISGAVNGRRIAVGSLAFFHRHSAFPIPHSAFRIPHSGHSALRTPSTRAWFGYAGEEPSGYLDLADALRPEAVEFVAACKASGMDVALFSGDSPETTDAMARAAGISSAAGGLRPEEKTKRVRALRAEGRRVMYVGDGFNDAEALAAADVGVALASGADLAMLSAPVVVTSQNLWTLRQLLQTARRTAKVVRGNFIWAFVYNIALLPVAAFGYLAPIYAAALMALSSASVAIHSMTVGQVGNLSHSVEQVGNLSSEPLPRLVVPTSVGLPSSGRRKWEPQTNVQERATGCQPVPLAGEVVGP